jgi:hypothetical protein
METICHGRLKFGGWSLGEKLTGETDDNTSMKAY